MSRPTTYRVCWAPPAYMVWRIVRLSVTGAGPAMRRRTFWRLAREDLRTYGRRTLYSLSRDGLVPPWQAERGCGCNAVRGWTRTQAIRRVEALHAQQVRFRRCEDQPPEPPELRLVGE